jgi:hypothetical protein
LLARAIEVFRVELRLRVCRVAAAAREGQHVPADAEESNVSKRAAELLAVLKNVLGSTTSGPPPIGATYSDIGPV